MYIREDAGGHEMKWTAGQIRELKELCYAGKRNADIARVLGCDVPDVYSKRDELGITVEKCKACRPAEDRTESKIMEEIGKVMKARKEVEKKVSRCDARIDELLSELLRRRGDHVHKR